MASSPPPIEGRLRKSWHRTINFFETALQAYVDAGHKVVSDFNNYTAKWFVEPTLEDTLVEKIGGGPHGYGDPADTSIRKEEHYLFPRMVWKKVRYEKCCEVVDNYYACLYKLDNKEVKSCRMEEKAMFDCKAFYYSPEHIDELESEVIDEYVKFRSVFRQTGSDDDLWKLKMLMLEPLWDKLRERSKVDEGNSEFKKWESTPPQSRII